MLDQELEKILEQLNEKLEKLLDKKSEELGQAVSDRISEAHKENAHLSIVKNGDGKAKIIMEGTNLSMLVALAGLEKTVLEKTHVPSDVWKLIKETVGTKEVN